MFSPPSPGTERRMREELFQEESITAQDVQHLKDWISKQSHLPSIEDGAFLERFLYGCKYRVPRCKEVLDMYFTVRGAVPEFFKNRDPTSEKIRSIAKIVLVIPLRQLSPAGYRVVLYKLTNCDANNMDVCAYFMRCFMLLDLQLQVESTLGYILVIDLKNATFSLVLKFTPPILMKFFVCLQDAFPIRIKEVHFVNAPTFINYIMDIIKPMMKEKLRKRIFVHVNGVEGLHKSIPSKMLPADYGGQEPTSQEISDAWQKMLESYQDWFKKNEFKIADETKRIGKIINSEELFGIDGCFRKLSID